MPITVCHRDPSFDEVPVEIMLVEITADCGMSAQATGASGAEMDAGLSRLTLVSISLAAPSGPSGRLTAGVGSVATSGRLTAEIWSVAISGRLTAEG